MRATFAGPGQSTDKKDRKPNTDPGKNLPSSSGGSNTDFYSRQQGVIGEVSKGAPLKPAKTVDKSGPQISGDVKVKKVDRQPFLNEVKSDHDLHHVDSVADRSAPRASVKENKHGALLAEVKSKGGAEDDE